MERKPEELLELCRGKKIFIQTHNFPDPDAIGASFGLQQLLQHFGIESQLCHEGQIDKLSAKKMLNLCGITMYPYADLQSTMKEEDMIILVDCQKNNGNTTDLIGDELAVIDHHPTFAEVQYQYSDLFLTGACCSIVADYYRILGVTPSAETATALLYGLRMDTLNLSRGVTAFDVEMYAYLFTYADSELLSDLESNNMEFSDLQAYGTAINHVQVYGKVGFSYIDYDCPDAMIGILSDFLLSLQEVEIAVIYAQRDAGYKLSVRSEMDDVHAGELVHDSVEGLGNGGGHAVMAGGFIQKEALAPMGADVFRTIQNLFITILQRDCPKALE